jgi:hypothetical protein
MTPNAGSDLANTGDAGRCESMWSIRDQRGFSPRKICKKGSGVTISIASYEPSVSKSLSRETRKSANAATAEGTIMSSFGSRTIPMSIGMTKMTVPMRVSSSQ